jgi:transposase
MARALSVDLRQRVVAAIGRGLSRRQAAERFGVSAASAVRWAAQAASSGDLTPQKQGGDRRSARIEAEADFILGAVEIKEDITLAELQARLAERGLRVGLGTLWRFFRRRHITVKNVWPAPFARGLLKRSRVVCANVSGLTSLGSQPRWRSARPGPHKRLGVGAPFFAPGCQGDGRPSGHLHVLPANISGCR